jgi:hypothetical protein
VDEAQNVFTPTKSTSLRTDLYFKESFRLLNCQTCYGTLEPGQWFSSLTFGSLYVFRGVRERMRWAICFVYVCICMYV